MQVPVMQRQRRGMAGKPPSTAQGQLPLDQHQRLLQSWGARPWKRSLQLWLGWGGRVQQGAPRPAALYRRSTSRCSKSTRRRRSVRSSDHTAQQQRMVGWDPLSCHLRQQTATATAAPGPPRRRHCPSPLQAQASRHQQLKCQQQTSARRMHLQRLPVPLRWQAPLPTAPAQHPPAAGQWCERPCRRSRCMSG